MAVIKLSTVNFFNKNLTILIQNYGPHFVLQQCEGLLLTTSLTNMQQYLFKTHIILQQCELRLLAINKINQ